MAQVKKQVTLKGARYQLERLPDGAGDSGYMLNAIDPKTGKVKASGKVIVGCSVQCGTPFARTYSTQDWWLTTPVTKILNVNKDKTIIKFSTSNSTYLLKVI